MNAPILRMQRNRPYPPRVSGFTAHFWAEMADGRLTTSRCGYCGRISFPPKALCPECWSQDIGWTDMPREGVLYSWTRIHAGPEVFQHLAPYVVGIVDFEQGLRLACPVVVSEGMEPAIGARVEMIVMQFDDGPLFAARMHA